MQNNDNNKLSFLPFAQLTPTPPPPPRPTITDCIQWGPWKSGYDLQDRREGQSHGWVIVSQLFWLRPGQSSLRAFIHGAKNSDKLHTEKLWLGQA